MKYLKFIIPVVIVGAIVFFYFFKSGKNDQLFDYLPVRLSKDATKISLIDYDGKVVLEDAFKASSSIYPINGVITEITEEGKANYWVIKNNDKVKLIDKEFNGGTPFYEDVAVVRDDEGKLSLINKKGEALIPNLSQLKEYNVVLTGVMSDGLIRFKTDAGKWGYVDKSGNVVIKPDYKNCENFVNGKARVINDNDEFKIINKKGEQEFKGAEETAYYPLSDNNVLFAKEDKGKVYFGVNDLKGKKVIADDKYRGLGMIYNGILAAQDEDNEWGVINTKQEVVGDLKFHFKEKPVISKSGFVIAQSDKELKLYNKSGKLVKSLEDYNYAFPVAAGKFAAFKKSGDRFELIDEKGKQVGDKTFYWAVGRELENYLEYFQSPEIVMNQFTIESTYFDFEKLYTSTFVSISTNDLAGINNTSSIAVVLQKFPHTENLPALTTVSKINDYSIVFSSGFLKGGNSAYPAEKREYTTETKVPPPPLPPPPYGGGDRTSEEAAPAAEPYYNQAPAPVDNYPYLSSYNYSTYKGADQFRFTFNFDSYIKNSYSSYEPGSNYDLNLNAHINSIQVDFGSNYIGNKILKKKLQDKLVAAGWKVNSDSEYSTTFSNNKNQYTITLNSNSLLLNFGYYVSPATETAPAAYDAPAASTATPTN